MEFLGRLDWLLLAGDAAEILLLACLFYYVFLFFRGTRSAQVLTGLVFLLLLLFGATRALNFDALNWLLSKLSVYLAIGLLIIFQPEIRRALAELGKQHVFTVSDTKRNVVDQIVQAATSLAERRIGALVAIEREIGTRAVQETGVKLDSKVVAGLLASIFYPHAPLHDGGVIVQGDRIVAAGCLFPLSERGSISKSLGTRHRAAVGLTEETDAVVVVVSEETGTISVSYRGRLSQDLDADRLRRFLYKILTRSKQAKKSPWDRAKEHLDLTPEGIARSEDLASREKSDGAE
jgi:diadenylate cyclase